MTFYSHAAQETVLISFAFALMMVACGEHAHAGAVSLEATYTISFARIRVGDITATVEVRDNEYAISARGGAGGIIKMLLDGEGSFTTRGTIKDDHPVPTTFTSKIVSGAETSEVTMVLDEGGVKELEAAPPASRDLVIMLWMSHASPHSMLVAVKPAAEAVKSHRVEKTRVSQPESGITMISAIR
jgi:hypothetical protein